MNPDDPLRDLLTAAPDLSTAPSILMRLAAQPGDRRQNAQATARALQVAAHHKARKQVADNGDDGLLHKAWNFLRAHSFAGVEHGDFGKSSDQLDQADQQRAQARRQAQAAGVQLPGASTALPGSLAVNTGTAMKAMGAGLAEAQHQYRAMRDIQQTHGTLAALLEGGTVGLGATGGAFLGGPEGAVLGGEVTADVTMRSFFRDSWERTQDAEGYRDGNGNKVMFGNDVASAVQLQRGSMPHTVLSGLLNFAFDASLDPLAAAGGIGKGWNATERAAPGLLGRVRGDTVIRTVDDFDRVVATRPGWTRVAADLARKQPAEIVRDYAKTPLANIAVDLGNARTVEGVNDVMRDAITLGEIRGDALPVFVKHGNVADEPLTGAGADDVIGRMTQNARRVRNKLPMKYDAAERRFTAVEIDPASNKATDIESLRRALKFSNLSERVIDGTVNDYLLSTSVGERRLIARNAFSRAFLAQVMRHDPGNDIDVLNELAQRVKTDITAQMGGVGGMEGAEYGYNVAGHSLSTIRTPDGSATAAIYAGQRGPLKLPEYSAWVRATREEAGGIRALYGRMDDFAFRHVTVPFKSLALVTGGFAVRVGAMAEGVPAAFREGVVNLVRSGVTARNARRAFNEAPALAADEENNIAEAALALMHDGRRVVQDERLAKHAVDLTIANDGHIVPPALRAGHFETDPRIPAVERNRINFYRITQDTPALRETERFTGYRSADKEFPAMWGRALNEAQRDEGARIHARAYADTIRNAPSVTEPPDLTTLTGDLFHGTSSEMPGDVLGGRYDYGSGANNLYGPGVYMTGDPNVALTYTNKGRGTSPAVYSLKWGGGGQPRLLDLDAAMPEDARAIFHQHVQDLVESDVFDFTQDTANKLQRLVEANAPASQVYDAIREAYSEARLPKYEIDSALLDLHDELEGAGYDGFTHVGGQRTGNAAHKVTIIFDPAKLEVTGKAPSVTRGMTSKEIIDTATREAIRADEAWLRAHPEVVSDMMRANVAADAADPILEFARTRVEATKGLTHYLRADDQPVANVDLLKQLGSDAPFSYDRLAKIEPPQRPLVVKGRVRVPDTKGNVIERLTNVGFRKIVDPIINSLGRNHQYLLEYARARDALDGAVAEGLFSHEEAVQKAQEIAVGRVARFIHNPAERTQVSTLLRNFAPFYFAQEQSYRRLGRMLAYDPAAFRRYQIANAAMTDIIHRQEDAEGRSHLVIPALGFLDETGINALHAVGLPVAQAAPTAILGNANSLDTVLPFNELSVSGARPSWSVFVTMPARALAGLMPEAKRYTTPVIGDVAANGAWWEQLVPNTALRNAMKGIGSASLDSATIATVQALAYRQNVAMSKWIEAGHDRNDPGAPRIVPPPTAPPEEKKQFQERVRNQARITYMMKAVVSEFSPLAPHVDIGDYGIKQGMEKAIRKYGIVEGTSRYLEAHPDATPYTVFASEATSVPVQPYHVAQQFVDKHHALFRDYPNAAAYLIPQDDKGKFDNAAYQEQLAMGLRERKGFKQFVKDMYVSEGFAQYEDDLRVHEQAITDAGRNRAKVKAEQASWSDYLHNALAVNNPVWWDYFTSSDRANRRNLELRQLRELVKDKRAPNTKLTVGIRGLLSDLDTHMATLENGRIDGWSSEKRDAEVNSWTSYLDSVSDDNPELRLVISRLFRHLGAN